MIEPDSSQSGSAVATPQQTPLIPNLTLFGMSRDMRFVGIFYIIVGGLYCLTIFGALIGVPWIISGIRLRDSGDAFDSYADSRDDNQLRNAIEQQRRFFRIQKILLLVSLALVAIGIIIAIAAALFVSRNPYTYRS